MYMYGGGPGPGYMYGIYHVYTMDIEIVFLCAYA